MKYLINFKKETIITIFVFATILAVVVWAIVSLFKGTFSVEQCLALIAAVFEYFGWYFNMPTSEENSVFTRGMRAAKEEPEVEEELPFDYFEDEGDENVE